MRKWTLRIWILAWLTMVWVLLWGTVSVANVLSGVVVALGITLLLPLPSVPVQGRLHPLSLLRLALHVAWWLAQSSVQVAWLAIRPGRPPLSAVLRGHLALKSDLVLALAVNIMNLTPGTIVLEIDQARRLVYVHVLDVGNERSVERFYRQMAQLERLLIAAFERDSEWRPAATESEEVS
ncbi:multicomponent Na+:H+ antiporter subunit E [Mycolicibacterium sp. BK556]|uniref:Na+/H+ antiporter subunit E n=1 Tax=Mycobacteriaceae TaxID=1762 RepID=UPI00105BAE83|nr:MULTISPECIES: Na+/H+ antiporter subunit E [Mycobacteriaceae]MBB3605087.1 multicomponent Na+:H+ antiporter subunit E [Mycolicibacterium sp. BK556]MBB3635283.1 multicomponent Na+:H+ antiporter subunit E [Mycolicibacterium sp. BK607]TDO07943.1 multicomponent Na+:H+ antiporter subunit E [Mycobacterium sp. BK086]